MTRIGWGWEMGDARSTTEATRGAPPAGGDEDRGDRFTWPPRQVPPPEAGATSPEPGAPGPPLGEPRAGLRLIEDAWIGLTQLSWSAAAAEAGWVPERPGECCPRCGTSCGPFEADLDGCSTCRDKRLLWDRSVRLGPYEGVLREAILAAKYTAWKRTCRELGICLGHRVAEALAEAGIPPSRVVVCPVATSRRRRLARGVDHTAILAGEVARVTGGRLARPLRRLHRPPQQGLAPDARRRNVAGSFRASGRVCRGLSGRLIVLVDDVRTTGATLSAAGRAVREGIRVSGGREAGVWTAVVAVTNRRGSG